MWCDDINSWNKKKWQMPTSSLFGQCIYVWKSLLRFLTTPDVDATKINEKYTQYHININMHDAFDRTGYTVNPLRPSDAYMCR